MPEDPDDKVVEKPTADYTAMEEKTMEGQYKKKGKISGSSVGAGGKLKQQHNAGYMPVDKSLTDYAHFLHIRSKLSKEDREYLPSTDFRTDAMMEYVKIVNQIVEGAKPLGETGRTARTLLIQLKNAYSTEDPMKIAYELAKADDDALTTSDHKYVIDKITTARKAGGKINFNDRLF
jgi:hypothetical protein